jgi:hypothetical protein
MNLVFMLNDIVKDLHLFVSSAIFCIKVREDLGG